VLASMPVALALALLAGAPDAAEMPPLPDCQAVQARIELPAEPEVKVYALCISPGLVTNLLLDEQLPSGAVELEAKEQEVLVAQAGPVVALVPSGSLMPGRRFNMTVRFGDGAAPSSANFVLVVHPAWGQRQVEVFRRKRTVESYQQALKVKEAEAQQCHEENEQLRAAQGHPDGLRGLRSAGLMEEGGVAFHSLARGYTLRPGSGLNVQRAISYRSGARVAVEVLLGLTAPEGSKAWEAGGAALIGLGGRELPVLPVWQEGPVTPGEERARFVMVEAQAKPKEAQGTFTLKLWDRGGTRTVTLDGVTFPPLQVSTRPRD
jgi:uncharacterized protein (TIGR02268 family)